MATSINVLWLLLSWHAFFRCGIKIPSRLCTIPHRKKRKATSMNGTRYLFPLLVFFSMLIIIVSVGCIVWFGIYFIILLKNFLLLYYILHSFCHHLIYIRSYQLMQSASYQLLLS